MDSLATLLRDTGLRQLAAPANLKSGRRIVTAGEVEFTTLTPTEAVATALKLSAKT